MQSHADLVKFPHPMKLVPYLMEKFGLPRVVREETGLLYHYTDAIGLKGIVASHRFWATHSLFLNDVTEGMYARDRAESVLEARAKGDEVTSMLLHATRGFDPHWGDSHTFVTSFCRDGDLLSQWRGYGGFGEGYALGFAVPELHPHMQVASLFELIYGYTELEEAARGVLDVLLEHLNLGDTSYGLQTVAEFWHRTLNFLALCFKHPSFAEEQEVRFVHQRTGDFVHDEKFYQTEILYRTRGGNVIPYVETPLTFPNMPNFQLHLPLRKIVIGPGVSFAQNKSSIEMLLQKHGYNDVEIEPSSVPFRK